MIYNGIKNILKEFRMKLLSNDIKDVPIESGQNENGFYRKWKSGYVEQWGKNTGTGRRDYNVTINLPISFTDRDYFVLITPITGSTSFANVATRIIDEKSFNGRAYGFGSADSNITGLSWVARGFIHQDSSGGTKV